jgi:uncharacterized protein
VRFTLVKKMDSNAIDIFCDRFLVEAIEAYNLVFGGGIGEETEGFVSLRNRGSTTELHRQHVETWLITKPELYNFEIGALKNAW